jgi:hypothetical protein
MENLDIAIDFGGSGLKVVASCGDRVIAFRIGPQIIEIFKPKYLQQEFSIDLRIVHIINDPLIEQ